ncbi:MAG: hypothetical protein ABR543_18540 [Gemmatimonadaceae bacterium]
MLKAMIVLALTSFPLLAQDSLPALLRANRRAMHIRADGSLTGAGADLLVNAGRDAQFFLIGEEHGVAEVPLVTAALFRALVQHGYRHLAIETGDALAAALNRAIAADSTGDEYLRFLRDHWPGAPFYNWREEASLLRSAIAAAGGKKDVLWGLDYDIMADRYALRRLRDIAPNPAARLMAEAVILRADSALAKAMATQNPGLIFMFGGPTDVYVQLRKAYSPPPGSEDDRIIRLMEETRAINELFVSKHVYQSNQRRALLSKQRFMRYLQEARNERGTLPRVMLKFGASHMMRGRTFTNVFDLGSLASEVADASGSRSFGVLMVGGAGSAHAQIDPRVMRSVEAPAEYAEQDWARPFFEAANSQGWTVYDLRALRPRIPGLASLPQRTLQVLYGFDAFVVLTGSGPQHDLTIR